ncbi:hypothetical protein NG798_15595 [Ancylothrix sp. C2]|uniref:hypothetical protein n=1 Tax=Ancylothrix sp. D3o TaxID=2953691 RepID=UPI0021BAF715|nr:hypothetical protein [Ancylothrix sp. D3o]MCT7951223.1 hypothetical protein [Ancylothrix sp. D3o]
MLNLSQHQILNKITPTTLALATIAGLTKPASAIEIPHSVLNGLYYPTGSQQFFSQGRQQFEKELQTWQKKRLDIPENLLKITDETPTHQPVKLFPKNPCPRECNSNPQN